jgi:hypothetical protein
LVDIIGVLAVNELIVDEELVALRMLAEWLRQLRLAAAEGVCAAAPALARAAVRLPFILRFRGAVAR